MVKLFVHGNPETTFVWSDLVPELNRRGVDDIVMASPPGFGAPVPKGFGGTRRDHLDWLIGEIEAVGEPVDLLGHDWGAIHAYGVAAERPDLLRSWAADCAGLVHPDYEWHPAAQVWQTEGDGEASIAQIVALTGEQIAATFGVPERLAPNMAEHLDAAMGEAILRAYRSAAQPVMRQLGDQLAAAERRPGLLIHATADAYVPPDLVFDVAARFGAEIMTLEGVGHWWMFDDPGLAADGLVKFWTDENHEHLGG